LATSREESSFGVPAFFRSQQYLGEMFDRLHAVESRQQIRPAT